VPALMAGGASQGATGIERIQGDTMGTRLKEDPVWRCPMGKGAAVRAPPGLSPGARGDPSWMRAVCRSSRSQLRSYCSTPSRPGWMRAVSRRSRPQFAEEMRHAQVEGEADLHQGLEAGVALSGQDARDGGLSDPALLGELDLRRPGELDELAHLSLRVVVVQGSTRRIPSALEPAVDMLLSTEGTPREVGEFHRWLTIPRVLESTVLGQAIDYVLSNWAGLTVFLNDPVIELDNNPAERSLRGPVIGRKGFYGSRSERGAQVACTFYTLFGSARLCGIDPATYVRRALIGALEKPGTILLPWDVAREAPSNAP